jgi:ABC-type lipoprotein export system ATPase subunit
MSLQGTLTQPLPKIYINYSLNNELGQTCVIVTHNEELANMADRKLVMVDGLD